MPGLPHIAILGRPNVGKSTLFNRLIGRRQAIVDSAPGITRDRIEGEYEWEGRRYRVSDLAGWDEGPDNPFASEILPQIERTAREADVLLLIVDGKEGLTGWDREIADKLRGSDSPIIVVVNKCDNVPSFAQATEFYELGLGDPIPVSATHNLNVDELLDRIAALTADLRIPEITARFEKSIRIAVVGHQNVGKSTLFNVLVGHKRAIVSDIPGTTRDAIDTAVDIDGIRYVFIDTAGLKKRARIQENVDFYAAKRTEAALAGSEVALLLIDASEGVMDTDMKIAGLIQETERACVIVASKWDHSEDAPGHRQEFIKHVGERIHFLSHAPVRFTSGLYNEGIEELYPAIVAVYGEFGKKISTAEWNRSLQDAVTSRPPPTVRGKLLKLNYITQTGSAPPTLTIFVNQPDFVRDQYKRYLERSFRKRFGFEGAPLVINIRRKAAKRSSSVV
jgi:GTP-binding protein